MLNTLVGAIGATILLSANQIISGLCLYDPDLNNEIDKFHTEYHPEGMDAFNQTFFRPNGNGGFSSFVSLLDSWIIVIFPIIFTFLFIFTFLNSPFKKRRGAGINAMATLVALFVLWTFMPMLASVVAGADGLYRPIDVFVMWQNIGTLVPVAAAMSTMLGIGMALFSAPFQRLRGAGIGVVGFSIVLWFVWMITPQIITSLTGKN